MLSKMKRSQIVYIRAIIVFLVAFLIINAFAHYQSLQRKEEEQNEAIYAAETTIRRMESQMDVYLTKSDFFKCLIESGYQIDGKQFDALALSLWLARYAGRLCAGLNQSIFAGGAARGRLQADARRLALRFLLAAALSIGVSVVGAGIAVFVAGILL